ncbi:TLD domain-containing protein 2 isoform X1 [Epinephelus lanceolatus]|uniref:nuclear receptor coactivator 7 isoform X1 n=1 Tax=Epinephelus lanceolatus TaxID=310571 RepID=UPI0014464BE5|nr:nuclear receptor coactivator 7 isoform X1 [Epinephelus lanceolatus]
MDILSGAPSHCLRTVLHFPVREKRNCSISELTNEKPLHLNFKPIALLTHKVKADQRGYKRDGCSSGCLLDMWHSRVQSLTEKAGTMKLLPENIKVLYFASDCAEPYVEIIKVKDSKRRLSLCSSEGSEAEHDYHEEVDALPVLSQHSQLLDDHQLETLAAHMPARTHGCPWQLVYSTAVHGSSLRTLYRNMAELDSPVLLVIKDMHKKVFGAFSSDPFKVSKHCYGTGETFLFSFNPEFQAYRWSGENSYLVSGNLESLHIGGGGGGFGLWLDADLYRGSSFSCPTFRNASLSTQEDFIVQDLEVWTVMN